MRSKIVFLFVVTSLMAAGLLVVRQERLHAVYEMTKALKRSAESDRNLWRLRVEIAQSVTPADVRAMAAPLEPLEPIPVDISRPIDQSLLAQILDRWGEDSGAGVL